MADLTFALPSQVYVHGVEGVLGAYRQSLSRFALSGPTLFSQIITAAYNLAAGHQDMSAYTVLLILTDGVIQDMPKTTEAIVAASDMPMSIVIVGVGSADFTNMEVLDGDDVALKTNRGVVAKRDIVQFVEFEKYGMGQEARLAKEVIAEIPDQILSYAKLRGVNPRPPSVATPMVTEVLPAPSAPLPPSAAAPVVTAEPFPVALAQATTGMHLLSVAYGGNPNDPPPPPTYRAPPPSYAASQSTTSLLPGSTPAPPAYHGAAAQPPVYGANGASREGHALLAKALSFGE